MTPPTPIFLPPVPAGRRHWGDSSDEQYRRLHPTLQHWKVGANFTRCATMQRKDFENFHSNWSHVNGNENNNNNNNKKSLKLSIIKISKNPNYRSVATVGKIIQEKFNKFRLRVVEGVPNVLEIVFSEKNHKCTQRPYNNIKRYKVKGTPYMFKNCSRVPV